MKVKVALLGAPGSGKTELARQLAEALKDEGSVAVIDDYIPELEKRSDVALGHFGSYIGNVQSALIRFEKERLNAEADIAITCGTVVETMVYEAINAMVMNQSTQDQQAKAINDRRAGVTMTWLGIFSFDTWDYDVAFYLPLAETATEESKYDEVVDQQIMEAAETIDLKPVVLTGQPEDRLSTAIREITQVAQDREPAVSN